MWVKQKAFTLIEVLVALAIFSVIAVISVTIIANTLSADERVIADTKAFTQLQQGLMMIQYDVMQLINRSIIDQNHKKNAAVYYEGNADESLLSLTVLTKHDPLEQNSLSALVRVGYWYHDHALYKLTWPTLDRVNNHYSQKKLIGNIADLEWQLMDTNNNTYTNTSLIRWNNEQIPKAITLKLSLGGKKTVEKIYQMKVQS